MKLPKYIRTNYWYINRNIIGLIWLILIALYCIATLLLNLINLL